MQQCSSHDRRLAVRYNTKLIDHTGKCTLIELHRFYLSTPHELFLLCKWSMNNSVMSVTKRFQNNITTMTIIQKLMHKPVKITGSNIVVFCILINCRTDHSVSFQTYILSFFKTLKLAAET